MVYINVEQRGEQWFVDARHGIEHQAEGPFASESEARKAAFILRAKHADMNHIAEVHPHHASDFPR